MLSLPPLSLYLHIPWCVRKCPYCDFNSHKAGTDLPEADYTAAVIEDLKQSLELVQGRKLHTIFIGGGTPSLFSPGAIEDMLNAVEKYIGFEAEPEITMEANPGTFEQAKFTDFRRAGVNRLSIGVQSFSDLHLQQLGRIHGRNEALAAINMARNAGFDNINLDLMHGLPGQTPMDAQQDLKTAIELEPNHLSWYQLTVEPNTEFYSRPPVLPEDDTLADIQIQGESLLNEASFKQYEISAYAAAGKQSKHNVNYWQFGDYLGLGAGAHGKITQPQKGAILRTQKTRQPQHYLDPERSYSSAQKPIENHELPLEFMMNILRLVDGGSATLFSERTGLSSGIINNACQGLRQKGLLNSDRTTIKATPKGLRYLNDILEAFVE